MAMSFAGSARAVDYVGSDACAACHTEEHKAWQISHHFQAMLPADEGSVLGDFNDAVFDYYGNETRFYRREGKFIVETQDSDGEKKPFEISHTFGFYPLQQYLIAFPGGRYQALSLTWDSRPAESGGQRWFHLYPDEEITADDALHWTGAFQNWNSRCASCHSTNLRKNYTQSDDTYDTSWSEVNVACEACHGPASNHLEWAVAMDENFPEKGFRVSLADRGSWTFAAGDTTMHRVDSARPQTQIETCAHCHALRSELTEGFHGKPFLEAHQSRFIADGLYFPDGQIREEVYVYGSFLQSRMHGEGVVCSNCHEPHTGQLRIAGNGVCLQCHQAPVYDVAAHHHHEEQSTGAQCANCHMPERTYMVVDPRRDHSIRVPRPDLSVSLGTPNACNQCHDDKDAQWAATSALDWYGESLTGRASLAATLAASWENNSSVVPSLVRIAADQQQPEIIRATAVQELGRYPDHASFQVASSALQSGDARVRIAALRALDFVPPQNRQLLLPLINDPVKSVRMELARLLAPMPRQDLPRELVVQLESLFLEYIEAQQLNADMPGAQLNLGVMYAALGDTNAAKAAYDHALSLAPQFVPALLNLADFYRTRGQDWLARPLLEKAVGIAPGEATVYHSLGLLQVRQKQVEAALPNLARAAELAPEITRYAYVYAVAVESTGQLDESIEILEKALALHPSEFDLLNALVHYNEKAGRIETAANYRAELERLYPQGVQQ